jgi:hypothetical protein
MKGLVMQYNNDLTRAKEDVEHTARMIRSLPFDLAREHYGMAVQFGLFKRSMLAWSKFERQLDLLEKVTLGPWARRV